MEIRRQEAGQRDWDVTYDRFGEESEEMLCEQGWAEEWARLCKRAEGRKKRAAPGGGGGAAGAEGRGGEGGSGRAQGPLKPEASVRVSLFI